VRRSRDRFWSGARESAEKLDAHWTLYECLVTLSKLIAPFTPFLAETLWRNLAGVFGSRAAESVHLCDYPVADVAFVDETLSERMRLLREIASLGRSARMDAKLKVRQPLSKVEVILADMNHRQWLEAHDSLLLEELNVKLVEYTTEADQYINYQVQPNFPRLGPRLGRRMPQVKKALSNADGAALMSELKAHGKFTLTLDDEAIDLDDEDLQVRLQAKEGWAAAQGTACVVVLSTELTDELLAEGLARDVVRNIQECRKALNCDYTDRIAVGVVADAADVRAAVEQFEDYIRGETLAASLNFHALPGVAPADGKIAGSAVRIYVQVVNDP
jgi:isoleucyl-tRNA synthetase